METELLGGIRKNQSEQIGKKFRWRTCMAIAAILAFSWMGCSVCAQTAFPASEPIRSIFVGPFRGKFGSANLRKEVVERLRRSSKVTLVNSPSDADAVVEGDGELWVEGYQTLSPRAGSSMRQTVYGGYLSLEVKNRNGETVWSYLVTPGRMRWHGVDQDMADHVVKLMLAALARGRTGGAQSTDVMKAQIDLTGAGSTFAAPLYQEWIQSFEERQPHVHTNYQAVGSENGIQLLEEGKVDFAASNVPVSDEQMTSMKVKFRQFATVLGGVVPAYNLSDVGSNLRFTPEVLADIYLGRIKRWNDPKLHALNHGVSLPDEPIVVLHRSDGSGTSFAWTDFLSKTSPEWRTSVGTGMRVKWPTGQGATGNEGVAAGIASTAGAIGYLELTYALHRELKFGLVRNRSGEFVQANLTTLNAAARAAPQSGDLRGSLVNAPGEDAWPITTFTWLLVPAFTGDTQETTALEGLVKWMLTSGQRECSGLGYLPLPREIAEDELRQLDRTDAGAISSLPTGILPVLSASSWQSGAP
ncbi:MAG: phosphate ABC transporter substrate-binding protein PstS [Acidobacteriaceae bacterium]